MMMENALHVNWVTISTHLVNVINFLFIVHQWTQTVNVHNVNGVTISIVIKNANLFLLTVIRLMPMESVPNVNQVLSLMRMEYV